MSLITISSLKRISRDQLYQLLTSPSTKCTPPLPPSSSNTTDTTSSTAPEADIAIIDVRDSGKFRILRHLLSKRIKQAKESSRRLTSPLTKIDHIGGSIRPSLWHPSSTFSSTLPSLLPHLSGTKKVIFHCALSQQRGPKAALAYARAREEAGLDMDGQEVCILTGGFVEWQEKYGADEAVTKDWRREVWEDYVG